MGHKVGRYTLALALILMGGALMLDNLMATHTVPYLTHLWPVLLILLGLEWLYFSARVPEGERLRLDGGAIVLLVIIALVSPAFRFTGGGPFWGRDGIRINVPAPQVVIPNLDFFGNVAGEATRTYDGDAAQLKELAVTATSGNITVTPGDQFKVEMHVQAYGRNAEEAQQIAQQVQLQVTPGDPTQVRALTPAGVNRLNVSFQIVAPKAVGVRLHTSSGNIDLQGREGAVNAEAASGNIQVAAVKGNVDLRASSGNIVVSDVDGDTAATIASGNLSIRGAKGAVKANASSGSITVEQAEGPVTAQSSSGAVSVASDRVGGDYDLTTTSGRLRVTIPADAPVSVSARASSGSVSGPAWLTIGEGRNSGTGSNGVGTYKLTLHSSSGGIDLLTK